MTRSDSQAVTASPVHEQNLQDRQHVGHTRPTSWCMCLANITHLHLWSCERQSLQMQLTCWPRIFQVCLPCSSQEKNIKVSRWASEYLLSHVETDMHCAAVINPCVLIVLCRQPPPQQPTAGPSSTGSGALPEWCGWGSVSAVREAMRQTISFTDMTLEMHQP